MYQPALSYLPAVNNPPSFLQLLQRQPWATLIAHRWRHSEHINVLEARAALLAVRRLLSSPHSTATTVLHLLDNTAIYYALRKGRTSSWLLAPVISCIHALLLASNSSILPAWLPSEFNPADGPSRLLRSSRPGTVSRPRPCPQLQ